MNVLASEYSYWLWPTGTVATHTRVGVYIRWEMVATSLQLRALERCCNTHAKARFKNLWLTFWILCVRALRVVPCRFLFSGSS